MRNKKILELKDRKKVKSQKAITLIALIITIIILIILAGITLVALSGENGILIQANNAKEITFLSTLKEQLNLYKLNYNDKNIESDDQNIYIDGNKQEGNIYDILNSLKNSKFEDFTTIKNGKIHIDNPNLTLNDEVKKYIYDNLEDFYLVDYEDNNNWKIEIVNEEQKTCILKSVYVEGIDNGFLRLPDYIKKENVFYKVIGNEAHILSTDVKVENLYIPETFEFYTELKDWSVNDNYLQNVYIENGLETLNYGAFAFCKNLSYIKLPDSLKNMEGAIFFGCSNLSTINLPEKLEKIGGQDFAGTTIKEISIPKSVKDLGSQLFQDCNLLKKVIFLNEFSSIPKGTFQNSSVEIIKFPKNINEISNNGMAAALFKEIDIPSSVVKIGDNAFGGNSNLRKIRIPNSVKEIGEKIFNLVDSEITLTDLTIYTDNEIFINYINTFYPQKVKLKSYNEW